jgi:hypothetical protein
MTSLAIARVGVLVGTASTMPVVVWLLPQLLGAGGDPVATTHTALRALWVTTALALVVFGSSRLGASPAGMLLGVLTAIAVALPLCCLAWLLGAASVWRLAAGLVLLGASGTGSIAIAGALERVPNADVGDALRAAVQIGLATAIWGFHAAWLPWAGL